jgi:hypothetical protein
MCFAFLWMPYYRTTKPKLHNSADSYGARKCHPSCLELIVNCNCCYSHICEPFHTHIRMDMALHAVVLGTFWTNFVHPLSSKLFPSLLSFMVNNMEKIKKMDMHNINSRHKHDLHMLSTKFSRYQKGVCYAAIKLFSNLPSAIESYVMVW